MKKSLLGLLALAGAAPFVAARQYAAHLDRRDDELFPGLGSRVEVGDLTLHARVLGPDQPDGPTVIFENGMSSPLEFWGWIQPAIAQVATTVSYDRAGLGWSGKRRLPHSAEQAAADLEDLLAVLGRPGPYVLVGHSYGGLLVRQFAHRNPEQVAGMVLIDSAHPDQFDRSSRQRLGLSPTLSITRQRALATSFGLSRKKSADETAPLIVGLPEAEGVAAKARLRSAHSWRGTADEMTAWLDHVNAEVRQAETPPGCRLAVITSGRSTDADPVHGVLQRELTALVDESRHEIIADAEHMSLLTEREHAQIVTKVIEEMVLSIRGRKPQRRRSPRQGE